MNLTDREAHFEFGENWRDYAKSIDQPRIEAAIAGVRKLFPAGLSGKAFLDIGCGSGLHALAALSLGAKSVTAVDIDENSVSTTRALLTRLAPDARWSASVASVFDLSPTGMGTFDVVYSWGVLHHTGDMWRAIESAAAMVSPGGSLAIAIYRATHMDAMWKAEKRVYSAAPAPVQWLARQGYMSVWLASQAARGRNPIAFVRNYNDVRGMNFSHDAHDWLGGYPYETATPEQIRWKLTALGFNETHSFVRPGKSIGLLGSGCNEFVFRAPQ